MTARQTGPKEGSIFCDVKTVYGTCNKEFESLPDEPYLACMDRAIKAGWVNRVFAHLCPEHAWLALQ